MSDATTIVHLKNQKIDAIERALDSIFAAEGLKKAPRVEGTYSAVLERVTSPDADTAYRYLLLRPSQTGWTPLLELGLRADGLDIELSHALGGATIVSIFQYDEIVSGYRVVANGEEIDRYLSDPTAFEEEAMGDNDVPTPLTSAEIEAIHGRPERFADLLPFGTAPEDFARVVLLPGWWEEHDSNSEVLNADEADLVDEVDRARCIGLALELWTSDEYPFAGELEDIANRTVGPAIALAWE
jgi:hypothetical protein